MARVDGWCIDEGEGGVKAGMDGGVDTWVSQWVDAWIDGWISPATSQMMDKETIPGWVAGPM